MTPLDALLMQLVGPTREGGVADVGDGKGVTRWGQTLGWLQQFNLSTPTNAQEAIANYRKWLDLAGLTPIVEPGDALADILLDFAVMAGHRQAIKTLQAALGVVQDGTIGPQTRAVALTCNRLHTAALVIAGAMEYKGAVITSNPARAVDAKGWAARDAQHVRSLV